MKRNPLLLLLFAFTLALSSCNNDDDPAPPAVVGRWNLDRVVMSNWAAPLTQVNGAALEPAVLLELGILDYGFIQLDVRNGSNRFYRNSRDGAFVDVTEGTWTLTNNELVLKDDTGDEVRYTFDPVRETLTGQPLNRTTTIQLADSSTRQVSGQVTFVFERVD